jgi:hypothetical protein
MSSLAGALTHTQDVASVATTYLPQSRLSDDSKMHPSSPNVALKHGDDDQDMDDLFGNDADAEAPATERYGPIP